ncbi:nuclear transport factor 2 family protein [Flavobacterium jejuense]|uniref:Nuclear transport factor 2 family protein n=1 Tax=Flavobacterium jejuense TaxID=1544455 RepID=A0ABX0IVP6_9FLAO|nr:nuclear transport factor 2 family protein [Flavobacterium jejuense]NHN25884.1 nuclear transport factor 2 family protein [Flavobacterium jejuense]
MTNKEQIQKFYLEDGIRDIEILQDILHKDVNLEWVSSDGLSMLNKGAILKLANELKQNYHISEVNITHLIQEEDKVVVKYNHIISTIENPSELIPIARFIVIWEFLEDKLYRGYQISQPI